MLQKHCTATSYPATFWQLIHNVVKRCGNVYCLLGDYLSQHIPDTTANKSTQDEHNTEEYINYIAKISLRKSMTVSEIESCTQLDATLQFVRNTT
jgi:hypothetical protein